MTGELRTLDQAMGIDSYAATPEEFVAAVANAETKGLTVRRGNNNLLTIDLDYPKGSPQYEKTLWRIKRFAYAFGGVDKVEVCESRSGNVHLYVHIVVSMVPQERALYQACLGSDGTRELLNFLYAENYNLDRNILFDLPDAKLEEVIL